jgi:hypothetical protein
LYPAQVDHRKTEKWVRIARKLTMMAKKSNSYAIFWSALAAEARLISGVG